MSKKKHPEHINHERWLVSYADFITLLFAFFVVLFASGQADKKKQQKFASAFQNAFSQMALFTPASRVPALHESSGNNPDADPMPIQLPIDTETHGADPNKQAPTQQALTQQLEKIAQHNTALHTGDLDVHTTTEGLVVSLHEAGFFASGSAELEPAATSALLALAATLPPSTLRVEGHTDNLPMHSALYASNWELSTARASAIARFLLDHHTVAPENLSVSGYAEFHPTAPNTTPEGRAKNRRVDIVILRSK